VDNSETVGREKMLEIAVRARAQIIYHNDRIAATQVVVYQVGSDKTASTCYQYVYVGNLAQGGVPRLQLPRSLF